MAPTKIKSALAGGRSSSTAKRSEAADTSLRRAVLARLISDPLVSTGHIGVAAADGVVTLSGYVTNVAQKDAAKNATGRVKGVGRIADDVVVAVPHLPVADGSTENTEARATMRPRLAFGTLAAKPSRAA